MSRRTVDRTLWYLTALLIAIGISTFFSASLSLLPKGAGIFTSALTTQLGLGLMGGLGALALFSRIPLGIVKRYAPYFFGITFFATLLVFVPGIGIEANGAHRWLDLRFATMQPAEFLKISYVILLGVFLAHGKNAAADMRGLMPFAAMSIAVACALLLQPDTDSLAVVLAAGVAMMWAAGMRITHIGALALLGVILIGSLLFLRPYLLERVHTFFNPGGDPSGAGYQIQQSLIAVGSGELWGRGFGQSLQKFNYLPEASTDSIFAVFAEETGFIGASLLVVLFLFFSLRGMWVAARARDMYGGLIALGLAVLIGGQAFLNMASMINLVPVGGLPLPFVSHGGSALLATLAMAGLMLNVSRTVKG